MRVGWVIMVNGVCPGAYNRGGCGRLIGEDPYDFGLCEDCVFEVECDFRRWEVEVDLDDESE